MNWLYLGMVYTCYTILTSSACLFRETDNNITDNKNTQSANCSVSKEKEVCMKDLGCFAITSDFKSSLYRPINALPNDRVIINTRFLLYTKQNVKKSIELRAKDKKSFTDSSFNVKVTTMFIIHGFVDTEVWMLKLKDELLLHGDYNVILVDWSGGSLPPYFQASANARVVGAEIALFISSLKEFFGIKPEDCYLIGHSLGAHASGYAGKRLKNLGRITALDPAGPYFQNLPATVRLDQKDAKLVDVIHTNSKPFLYGLGMSQHVGHVDFFPNDGQDQPGCRTERATKFISDGLAEGFRRFLICNHQRSVDFYLYSINYIKVPPVAYECSDYESYLNGQCSECGSDLSRCAIMGFRTDQYKHRPDNMNAFYVKTSGLAPFWVYHYQVTVKLLKPEGKYNNPTGSFEINLHGSKRNQLSKLQSKYSTLVHGDQLKFLVTSEKDLGQIQFLTFKWLSSSRNPLILIFKPKLYLQYVTVMPMNIVEKSPRSFDGKVFCAQPEQEILAGISIRLARNNKCDMTK